MPPQIGLCMIPLTDYNNVSAISQSVLRSMKDRRSTDGNLLTLSLGFLEQIDDSSVLNIHSGNQHHVTSIPILLRNCLKSQIDELELPVLRKK